MERQRFRVTVRENTPPNCQISVRFLQQLDCLHMAATVRLFRHRSLIRFEFTWNTKELDTRILRQTTGED
jgi:hypothetical protein